LINNRQHLISDKYLIPIMADLAEGTWRMTESNNFDDYMKALGKFMI
jgi:hypothetical protein